MFTITSDNASSNEVAIDYVKKSTERDSSILGGELMHMRCKHLLNLIVQSRLKSIHESIAKVRNAVQYVRASPARFEKSQEFVDKEKIKVKCLLSLDVPTRWNSTYLMLDCALKFVRVLDKLEEEFRNYKLYFCETDGNGKKPIGPLSYLDWENIKTFVKVLSIFLSDIIQNS